MVWPMRTLYHFWISPACRQVRLALEEKGLDFDLRIEKTWERRDRFLGMNPAGEVPVLLDENDVIISGNQAICEYLEEVYSDTPLMPSNPVERAEIRRLMTWFDRKFYAEVTDNLVEEKIMKRLNKSGTPNTAAIRAGHHNIHYHLDYITYLIERRSWLAGEEFSLADITAAAQLSCIDYLSDVPWEQHPTAKVWYSRVKSRPSFRGILGDNLPGMPAPKHYADLDF